MEVELSRVGDLSNKIIDEVEKAIIGKRDVLQMIMASVLADGHVLLEDFPGLGKTLLANSLAKALGLEFRRIQFTPDLLPGDITGGYIYNRVSNDFELRKGPLFANIVLADEINRASPKTQSALLEAMQERQVTLEGETMILPKPFLVFATQNPIEYEGTFPLPEAQLDRFMMKLSIGYPSHSAETEILQRRRERKQDDVEIEQVTNGEELLAMRAAIESVNIDEDIDRYMVSLMTATRKDSRVTVGASPRGSLALMKLARAKAAFDGRDFVIPDDVKHFIKPALRHRLILVPEMWMQRNAAQNVLGRIVDSVPVPVLESV